MYLPLIRRWLWSMRLIISSSSSNSYCSGRLLLPFNLCHPPPPFYFSQSPTVIANVFSSSFPSPPLLPLLLLMLHLLPFLTPALQESWYGSHETQFSASLDLIPLHNWALSLILLPDRKRNCICVYFCICIGIHTSELTLWLVLLLDRKINAEKYFIHTISATVTRVH